jgi:hypothetical protein
MRFRTWYWVAQCDPPEIPWVGDGKTALTGTVVDVEIDTLVDSGAFVDSGPVRPHPAPHAAPSSSAKP